MRQTIRRNFEAKHFMRNIYSEVNPDMHIPTKLRVNKRLRKLYRQKLFRVQLKFEFHRQNRPFYPSAYLSDIKSKKLTVYVFNLLGN